MQSKQYMLLINGRGNGALMPFPPLLDLPPTKTVNSTVFDRTNRKKTTSGVTAAIYLERGANLDLDDYADAEELQPEELSPVQAVAAAKLKANDAEPSDLAVATEYAMKVTAPTGVETRIYGTSDDLIEVEGGYTGEIDCYGTDERKRGVLLVCSDGTALEVKYGKGSQGIWGITVLKKGTAYAGFEPCDDADADIYSDIVTLKGDIKYVYAANDWDKVK